MINYMDLILWNLIIYSMELTIAKRLLIIEENRGDYG